MFNNATLYCLQQTTQFEKPASASRPSIAYPASLFTVRPSRQLQYMRGDCPQCNFTHKAAPFNRPQSEKTFQHQRGHMWHMLEKLPDHSKEDFLRTDPLETMTLEAQWKCILHKLLTMSLFSDIWVLNRSNFPVVETLTHCYSKEKHFGFIPWTLWLLKG